MTLTMGMTSAPLHFFCKQFSAYARKSHNSHRDSARTDANTGVSSTEPVHVGMKRAPLRFFREQFSSYARKSRNSHRDSARTDANMSVSSTEHVHVGMTGAPVQSCCPWPIQMHRSVFSVSKSPPMLERATIPTEARPVPMQTRVCLAPNMCTWA